MGSKPNGILERWRKLSERQMELAVVIVGLVVLAVAIASIVMVLTWGFGGALIRLIVTALALLSVWAAVRWRRTIRDAYNRYQAIKPHPLCGNFPGKAAFLGPGTALDCGRGTLLNPLVYAVCGSEGASAEPSLIASGLMVGPSGVPATPLPYWPSYHKVSPAQRSVYLDWLLSGGKQLPAEIGYAFLFFYGLERRLLIDQADHIAVFDEVLRLRKLNAADPDRFNQSFESYTSNLLWLAVTVFAKHIDESRVRGLAESTRSWNEGSLSCLLTWFHQMQRPLADWAAYIVASQLRTSQRSVVVERATSEFPKLFATRYWERFNQGLIVQSSKRLRNYVYKPASAVISAVQLKGPHPLGLMSQFKKLSDTWNACVTELRGVSNVARKESRQAGGHGQAPPPLPKSAAPIQGAAEDLDHPTLARWEAMPPDIRKHFDHPLTDAICGLVGECTDEDGKTLIPVRRLASLLEVIPKERLSSSESGRIAKIAEDVGYCLEPDPRICGRPYRWDDVVTAFLRTTEQDAFITRYTGAAAMLRFGIAVAAADGKIDPDELSAILQDIESLFDLNDHEKRRLEALQALLLATGMDAEALKQIARLLKPEMAKAIAKLLLVIVAKDGIVTQDELEALRKCYDSLGFSRGEIEEAIGSLQTSQAVDEPVTIRPGLPSAAGEPLPAAKKEPVLRLNRAAIAQIMQDTHEVARMLAEAMSSGERDANDKVSFTTPFVQPPTIISQPAQQSVASADAHDSPERPQHSTIATTPQPEPQQPLAVETTDDGPPIPKRYAAFYQLLISRKEWDTKEVDVAARQQGLMLSGAMDALNEWAAEKYGGQLFVEDNGRILVEQAYLTQG